MATKAKPEAKKVEKAEAKPEPKVEKPKVTKPKAEKVAEAPQPEVGKSYKFNGEIMGTVLSLDPLTIKSYSLVGGCVSDSETVIENVETFEPMTMGQINASF